MLWPDYSLWHFISAVLSYSRDYVHLEALEKSSDCLSPEEFKTEGQERCTRAERVESFGQSSPRDTLIERDDVVSKRDDSCEAEISDAEVLEELVEVSGKDSGGRLNGICLAEEEEENGQQYGSNQIDRLRSLLQKQRMRWITKHAKALE